MKVSFTQRLTKHIDFYPTWHDLFKGFKEVKSRRNLVSKGDVTLPSRRFNIILVASFATVCFKLLKQCQKYFYYKDSFLICFSMVTP